MTLICAVAVFTLIMTSAMAAPYASLIRVSSTTAAEGFGLDISYVLNHAADTVTINIKDSGAGTVATFAGTTTQGRNTVSWDGTVDNAGGAAVPAGTGYNIEIVVDNNDPVGLTEYQNNLSGGGGGGQVFSGFSPRNALVFSDTDSDNFGVLLVMSSWSGGPAISSGIQFTMDGLTKDLADGTTDKGPASVDEGGTISNGSIWGVAFEPGNENVIWGSGQGNATYWYRADISAGIAGSAFLDADAVTTPMTATFPRECDLLDEGGTNYMYYPRSNGVIGKVKLNATNLDDVDRVDNITSDSVSTYAKEVFFDATGNMYFVSRSGAPAPLLYRWDAADVLAAPGTLLGTDNATWIVDFPTTAASVMGATIASDGKVYAATYGNVADNNAIYEIGDTATASIEGTAGETVGAELISGTNMPDLNSVYGNIKSDAYGNFFTFDSGDERLQCWTMGGNTSIAIPSPSSQDFDIVTPPSGISEWEQLM